MTMDMMRTVMIDGTGRSIDNYAPEADVFGKTGTARIFKNQQYNEDLHNALFIGMTELDEKKYLVGLIVKDPKINGDGGGDVAAPIFSEIIETIQNF